MMDPLPVAELIERHGTTNIANAMGLPISTVHGWKQANVIPGRGRLQKLKLEAFVAAVMALDQAKKTPREPADAA